MWLSNEQKASSNTRTNNSEPRDVKSLQDSAKTSFGWAITTLLLTVQIIQNPIKRLVLALLSVINGWNTFQYWSILEWEANQDICYSYFIQQSIHSQKIILFIQTTASTHTYQPLPPYLYKFNSNMIKHKWSFGIALTFLTTNLNFDMNRNWNNSISINSQFKLFRQLKRKKKANEKIKKASSMNCQQLSPVQNQNLK